MINPSATIPQDRIEHEEHFIKTADGVTIHTWLLLQADSHNVPTLIYFHGNAGNMGFLLKNAALMFAHSKINILLMDYRGYGKDHSLLRMQHLLHTVMHISDIAPAFVGLSLTTTVPAAGRSEGVPSEKGINLDAEAVLKFALAHPR
jgi:predicted alpha/beta-fold hydrolase